MFLPYMQNDINVSASQGYVGRAECLLCILML